ncbi:MAG: hypothetical protein JXA46_18645 [Dehalococcoidales bacterium]|nr:hypothetical protein [Dehalococcoidales bacterium]
MQNVIYEVEFRCHFDTIDEAFNRLPFLQESLRRHFTWTTAIYGREYFRSGQLIRTARVTEGKNTRYYLGWKGPDTGRFTNIRQEAGEEILPPSTRSGILDFLGGKAEIRDIAGATNELERLGYAKFMEFEGEDSSGYCGIYDVYLKMMTCRALKWPLIVEIEQTADTREKADFCQEFLYNLCRDFNLQERVIRDEPPTLLYKELYGTGTTEG